MVIPQQFHDLSPYRPYRQLQRPLPKVPGPYLKPLPPRDPQFEVLGYTSKGGAQERDDSVPSPVFTPLSRSRWSNPFLDQEEDDSQQKVDSNQKQDLLTYDAIPSTKFMRAPVYSLSSRVGKILSHLEIDPQFKAVIFKLSARFGRCRSSGRDTSRDFLQSHPVGCWRSANFALNQFATHDHWSLPDSHFLETCLRYSPLDYKLYLFNHFRGSVIKETTTIYNGFLDEMNKRGKYKHVSAFFYQMRTAGPQANSETYRQAVYAMYKRNTYDKVISLSNEMVELGFNPNYKTLLLAQYKTRRYHDVIKTSEKIEAIGLRHNIGTYNCWLNSLYKVADYKTIFKVYNDMKKSGMKSKYTYGIILKVLASTKRYEALLSLFNEMQQAYKEPISMRSYNILFKAMDHQGEYESLYRAFEEMKSYQMPDIQLYTTVIKACMNAKNLEKAKTYFLEGRERRCLGLRPMTKKVDVKVIDLHACEGSVGEGDRPHGLSLEIAQLHCECLLEEQLQGISKLMIITGKGAILRNKIPLFFENKGFQVQWDSQNEGAFLCIRGTNKAVSSFSSKKEKGEGGVDITSDSDSDLDSNQSWYSANGDVEIDMNSDSSIETDSDSEYYECSLSLS